MAGDHFGARLRRSREAAGLEVAEAAKALGWPADYVAALEGGMLGILLWDAVALSELYGIEVQQLRGCAIAVPDEQQAKPSVRRAKKRNRAMGHEQ